jgi:hypothetical protein
MSIDLDKFVGVIPSDLDALDDVIITGVTVGQALVWNGTNWVNQNVSTQSFNINLDSAEASVTRVVAGGRTTWTVTHNLNSLDLSVEVFRISNGRTVGLRIDRTGVDTIEASRAGTIADGTYRIIIK